MKELIGIIGFGNMGCAIGQRIKDNYAVSVFDKDAEKTKGLSGIKIENSIRDLVSHVNALILAIKPQDFSSVLDEIRFEPSAKLLISIAAGITTDCLVLHLGNVRAIRVMPNLPAKIGLGMICLARGKNASRSDLAFSEALFKHLGETLIIDESMMDAATAVSGSGPGYLYYLLESKDKEQARIFTRNCFIPELFASAQNIGFSEKEAHILSQTTGSGSLLFLEKTGLTPNELKNMVASKGGTTQAGLDVLALGGSLQDAVSAALKRAKELSKKE